MKRNWTRSASPPLPTPANAAPPEKPVDLAKADEKLSSLLGKLKSDLRHGPIFIIFR